MSTAAGKLAAFAVGLVGLFAVGLLAGGALDPGAVGEESEGHGSMATAGMDGGHGAEGEMGAISADPIRGLAVAEHGLRLAVDAPERERGVSDVLRFRVLAADGDAVRSFDLEHGKRMHLIVVRRDLTGFQHLHPQMAPDGTWTVPLELEQPGSYRLLADFSHGGEPTTLGSDLRVDGDADLQPLPAVARTALGDDGYSVRVQSPPAAAGAAAELRFEVRKDGNPVAVQPYLGAGGHLVALREGDLAFLHVHAEEHGEGGAGEIAFAATFPTAGRYRFFLQFEVGGRVQTVAFTEEVE
ncbi:MAG: hypothetical protein ACOYD4_00300 [Solirubrobacterales bacterium]